MGGDRQTGPGRPDQAAGQKQKCAILPGLALGLVLFQGSAQAGEGFAMLGLGGSGGALHSYIGVIYAPGASLSETGPLLRVWGKSFGFTYETDLPGRRDVEIDAVGWGVEADAGWQIAGLWGRAALFAGAGWRDHELTPAHPGSGLERGRLGLSLAADGEWRLSERFGVMANGSYLFSFDQYWGQARPFVHLGHGWKAGLDLVGHGSPDYTTVRAGVFTTGYELPISAFGRIFIGGEAGAQYDLSGERLSPYLGVHAGLLF